MKRPRAAARCPACGVGPSYNRRSLLRSGDIWVTNPSRGLRGTRDVVRDRLASSAPSGSVDRDDPGWRMRGVVRSRKQRDPDRWRGLAWSGGANLAQLDRRRHSVAAANSTRGLPRTRPASERNCRRSYAPNPEARRLNCDVADSAGMGRKNPHRQAHDNGHRKATSDRATPGQVPLLTREGSTR